MKNVAKNMTLVILGVAFCVGCVGAFIPTFNMDGYTRFLPAFAPLFISLIASIGYNSAVEKKEQKKEIKE